MGMTFIYMDGVRNRSRILDSTDHCRSSINSSNVGQEHQISFTDPKIWSDRLSIVPYVYIDDTNGSERLNLSLGAVVVSAGRQKTVLHARNSETFFLGAQEKSFQIGMKINPKKLR